MAHDDTRWHNAALSVRDFIQHGEGKGVADALGTQRICELLDELNTSFEYPVIFVTDAQAQLVLQDVFMIVCSALQLPPSGSVLDIAGDGNASVSAGSDILLSKFFQLVVNLVYKQQTALGSVIFEQLLTLLVSILSNSKVWLRVDALRALSAIVYDRGSKCSVRFLDLTLVSNGGLLLKLASSANNDIDSRRMAVNCLGNLCMSSSAAVGSKDSNGFMEKKRNKKRCSRSFNGDCTSGTTSTSSSTLVEGLSSDHYTMIFDVLEATLSEFIALRTDVPLLGMAKLLSSALRSMQIVISCDRFPKSIALNSTLTCLKSLIFFGMSPSSENGGVNGLPLSLSCLRLRSEFMTGSTSSLIMGYSDGSGCTTPMFTSASESEWSDSGMAEDGVSKGGRRKLTATAKVRQNALICLGTLVKAFPKKDMREFWTNFETVGTSSPLIPALFAVILNDLSAKVRQAALTTLMTIIDNSRQFISTVAVHQTSTSFTSFSQNLANTIAEIHYGLVSILQHYFGSSLSSKRSLESSTLVSTVRCLAVLTRSVPYKKVIPSLIPLVLIAVQPLILQSYNSSLLQAALCCISGALNVAVPKQDLSIIATVLRSGWSKSVLVNLSACYDENLSNPIDISEISERPALLQVLLQLSQSSIDDVDMCIEAYHALSSVASTVPAAIQLNWNQMESILAMNGLIHTESKVRCRALKFVEMYSLSLSALSGDSSTESDELDLDKSTTAVLPDFHLGEIGRASADSALMWKSLLFGALPELSMDSVASVRACVCDALSHIGSATFAMLASPQAGLCVTLLLRLAEDESPFVRAAACRALGVFVLYESNIGDMVFISDMINVTLKLLTDDNHNVRVRAAWAVANMSGALVKLRECKSDDDPVHIADDFSNELLIRTLDIVAVAASGSDKVRCNIVRAIGNLLRFIRKSNLASSCFNTGSNASTGWSCLATVAAILNKGAITGPAKVRWNACYAIGNVFHNSDLPLHDACIPWVPALFDALLISIRCCKNFKVRINATIALSALADRERFGGVYADVVITLVESLERIDEVDDLAEFRYKSILQDELVSSLCHVLSCSKRSDFASLKACLVPKAEFLLNMLIMYQLRGSDTTELSHGIAQPLSSTRILTAIVAVTKLFESQMITTIPVALLERYQMHAYTKDSPK